MGPAIEFTLFLECCNESPEVMGGKGSWLWVGNRPQKQAIIFCRNFAEVMASFFISFRCSNHLSTN